MMNQQKFSVIWFAVAMAIAAFLFRVFDKYEISLIYYAMTCAAIVMVIAIVRKKLEKTKS